MFTTNNVTNNLFQKENYAAMTIISVNSVAALSLVYIGRSVALVLWAFMNMLWQFLTPGKQLDELVLIVAISGTVCCMFIAANEIVQKLEEAFLILKKTSDDKENVIAEQCQQINDLRLTVRINDAMINKLNTFICEWNDDEMLTKQRRIINDLRSTVKNNEILIEKLNEMIIESNNR